LKKGNKISSKLKMKITKYSASEGTEYFLQFINKDDILFGLCRLRINKDKSAFVRELHIYGQSVEINQKGKVSQENRRLSGGSIQHTGLGKKLMKTTEEIAKKEKVKILKVISGVGVREYYRKLGYRLENEYMIKHIK